MDTTRAAGVFHEGEIEAQERAGVRAQAARLGPRMVQPQLDWQLAAFLSEQPFVIAASATPDGHVWASVLAGRPGFAVATAPSHVVIHSAIDPRDPLADALDGGDAQLGLLVLEPESRTRIRLNGTARQTRDGFELDLTEVFGNCPKYIQRRVPTSVSDDATRSAARVSEELDANQSGLVADSDTFFVASRHPAWGADASHRGGSPGFVAVSPDGQTLTFPDYRGNNMLQTLGNVTANPAVGLLFIDWDTGRTLQITGRAEIIWDDATRLTVWPDALRLVDVGVEKVIDRARGLALRWELLDAHRLNPPAPNPSAPSATQPKRHVGPANPQGEALLCRQRTEAR